MYDAPPPHRRGGGDRDAQLPLGTNAELIGLDHDSSSVLPLESRPHAAAAPGGLQPPSGEAPRREAPRTQLAADRLQHDGRGDRTAKVRLAGDATDGGLSRRGDGGGEEAATVGRAAARIVAAARMTASCTRAASPRHAACAVAAATARFRRLTASCALAAARITTAAPINARLATRRRATRDRSQQARAARVLELASRDARPPDRLHATRAAAEARGAAGGDASARPRSITAPCARQFEAGGAPARAPARA